MRRAGENGRGTWPYIQQPSDRSVQANFFDSLTGNYQYWPDWWFTWIKDNFTGCHYRELNGHGDLVTEGPITPNEATFAGQSV